MPQQWQITIEAIRLASVAGAGAPGYEPSLTCRFALVTLAVVITLMRRTIAALLLLPCSHGLSAVETLRAAARPGAGRPSPKDLLAAVVEAQGSSGPSAAERSRFFDALACDSPGRRWRLVYVVGRDAVTAARKKRASQKPPQEDDESPLSPSRFGLLRWWPPVLAGGTYVDEGLYTALGSAIQRFDARTLENENGFFDLFGVDGARFTVRGPFKWPTPEKRQVCAFQPTTARLRLSEAWDWEWAFPSDGASSFEATPAGKLPFFRFVLVDDAVAVAQGRSGSVALWARIAEG